MSAVMPSARGEGSDPHAEAQAIVREIGRDSAHREATATCVANASSYLERATRLRDARDEAHAQAADGVALEWARTARDLVRVIDLESKAVQARRAAIEVQAQVERAHAQLDENIARVGRLKAEIDRIERESAPRRVAVERHDPTLSSDAPSDKSRHAPPQATSSTDAGTPP